MLAVTASFVSTAPSEYSSAPCTKWRPAAFIVLLLLMIAASRRLEVYSRMPTIETGRNAVETTSFDRGLQRDLSFVGVRDTQ